MIDMIFGILICTYALHACIYLNDGNDVANENENEND